MRRPPIGLEHIVGAQKDGQVAQPRTGASPHRGQGAPMRGVGGAPRVAGPGEPQPPDGLRSSGNSGRGSNQALRTGGGARGARAGGGSGGMATGSWRSTGASRGAGGMQQASGALYDDRAEPEWMDDGLAYDENQNAQRMQDMEEWKRRMKEGAAGGGYSDPLQAPDDRGAVRESRFLRLFSDNEAPQQPAPGANHLSAVAAMLPPSALPHELVDPAGMFGAPAPAPGLPGDPLSKLYKVFGDKVTVSGGGAGSWPPAPEENGALPQHHPQPQQFSRPPESESKAPAKAMAASQRVKSASPAPINEALRGIVPTSVFRKSVQGSGGSSAAAVSATAAGARRPDSESSARSATPARNLPSWLVELSRGGAPPAAAPDAAAAGAAGPRDMVDPLERAFPALSLKPHQADTQSISSLSVQASLGAPSETNDGSVRRSSIGSHDTERDMASSALGQPISAADAANIMSTVADGPPLPEQVQLPPAFSMRGMMAMPPPPPHMVLPNGAMVPGMASGPPMPGPMPGQMPGPMPGQMPGQMPPMGMVPPPGHHMGFPPNMMFGMMPPPPPGMYGGMAPMNVPLPQMGGVPGGAGDQQQQQQMMLMKMMMADMPPEMMYGQMSAAQAHHPVHAAGGHMYAPGMGFPGMPMSVPQSADGGPVASAGLGPGPGLAHMPHHQQRQHQHEH
ncbi:hypothetical protein H4R21_000463 [Coemansia helicoidea]|uniref:Uncharacterized protein n=1 Tax=Coemansia helicoidea TaxID=1286919 RepID=A0ACC1LH47_9FUNG|nr:hypothetical protein H4R21_000463 [Coemansia helicoidea]